MSFRLGLVLLGKLGISNPGPIRSVLALGIPRPRLELAITHLGLGIGKRSVVGPWPKLRPLSKLRSLPETRRVPWKVRLTHPWCTISLIKREIRSRIRVSTHRVDVN